MMAKTHEFLVDSVLTEKQQVYDPPPLAIFLGSSSTLIIKTSPKS
jgi:hypothetical protein